MLRLAAISGIDVTEERDSLSVEKLFSSIAGSLSQSVTQLVFAKNDFTQQSMKKL
jgi:hypothetical protein